MATSAYPFVSSLKAAVIFVSLSSLINTTAGHGTVRCGIDFDDANYKCSAACGGSNGMCTPPEGCFSGLSVDACTVPTASPSKAPVPTISQTASPTETPSKTPTFSPSEAPSIFPTLFSSESTLPTMSPTLPLPTAEPPSPPDDREGDSRMIAYLGNWEACPSLTQYEKYTHIVIAFAVSYTWYSTKNDCDQTCTIGSPVPICNNQNNQALVDLWRSQGKKVILSFGGAGMGGSWSGDNNDCWEYCFGREASVVSQIDTIVRAQNFDGVDIDYEYFYNDNDPWRTQYGNGPAARYFLGYITRELKSTLPAGQNLITHAPMDPDMKVGTAYYNVLKSNAAFLDFLMPQYYNGHTRPAADGLTQSVVGTEATLPHYNNLVNDMFGGDATKVVFGFCIQDCSGTGSNANAAQASAVMAELGGYYPCNGGAFFWVSHHDYSGSWSQTVSGVISDSAVCGPLEPTISPAPSPDPPPPTTPPPTQPSSCHTDSKICGPGNPCTDGSCCSQWGYCGNTAEYCEECCQSNCWASPAPTEQTESTTSEPTTGPTAISTSMPTRSPITPPTPPPGPPADLIANTKPRCGTSETHAREMCGNECATSNDCPSGQFCWGMHLNYCSDPNFTPLGYIESSATLSTTYYRCGKSEIDARSFCMTPCVHASDCVEPGDSCYTVNTNYCGSPTSTSRRTLRANVREN